ncbi:MAG TPA: disulfide reductase, partial [Deltaproteobacteria bacterium]|nr:disulfide reductase [Deltaproteobacteria bacterium]
GKSDKVITPRALEDLIAKNDAKVKKADSVVMIQCVGSRTKERPYCSRYCCSEAMKNALKLKEMDPN